MNADVRDAWIIKTLSKIPSGLRILDAGAGSKRYKKFCSHLEYVSQDFCKYDGEGDGAGLQRGKKEAIDVDIVSDITKIPIPDNHVDAVLCTEVFEHIPNPIAAIKEFSRLLRSGGSLILTAPFCSLTHYAPYHFYSGFNRYFYEKFLPENGFEIISLEANGSFFEYLIQELSRVGKTVSHYTDSRLRYTSLQLKYTDKYYISAVINLLQNFRNADKGSYELLCFGYHVLAKKL